MRPRYLTNYSRERKKNPSPIEKIMATSLLRIRQAYMREYVIKPFIVDFYLPNYRTIIECDGLRWHRGRERYDASREAYLRARGYNIVRFQGSEFKDEHHVLFKLIDYLAKQRCKNPAKGIRSPDLLKAQLLETDKNFATDWNSIPWYHRPTPANVRPKRVVAPPPKARDPRFWGPTKTLGYGPYLVTYKKKGSERADNALPLTANRP